MQSARSSSSDQITHHSGFTRSYLLTWQQGPQLIHQHHQLCSDPAAGIVLSCVETCSCSAYEVTLIEVMPLGSSAFSIDDMCYPNEEVLYWSKDLLLPMSLVFSNSVCYPVQHLHNQSELQKP
jgi:hypothetical protein